MQFSIVCSICVSPDPLHKSREYPYLKLNHLAFHLGANCPLNRPAVVVANLLAFVSPFTAVRWI
jgi:hypothetical protein